ncbi:uncharacterized protein TM35_000122170 [Trypanosoma theileri]|uniref:Uncharacterized protein n=1 Tax=Trypanosoma theileri TaxID=67003 RepID=A0A1X0NXN3_9TRYP|nr:uncharacterized protein TM35_000122170 [Trypanosoma theileri]ORC89442.1 hypothetical protein TM35_000122170 [Trypanosoma theileri]
MSVMQLSATGRIACGGSFIDMYGGRPAANIEAVHPTGAPSPAPLSSWSQFPTVKRIRNDSEQQHTDAKMHAAGEHVAISFYHHTSSVSSQEMFFAVGLFRCDTWALQWAVRADSITAGKRVCEVCCLSAHTVAFLVGGEGGKNGKNSKKELYIATKADVPRTTKRENRQWRSFLADARLVVTGFESEDLCSIQALSATRFLLVTGTGRLVRITVSITPEVEVKSTEVTLLSLNNTTVESRKNVSFRMAVSSAVGNSSEELTYVAVFTPGGRACHVLGLIAAKKETVSKPHIISIPKGTTIERVEFAGPHILLVTLLYTDTKTFGFHFTCLVPPESPSETSFSCVSFDAIHMTAHRVPVMTMFNPEKEMHIVVTDRRHYGEGHTSKDSNKSNNKHDKKEGSWWTHLEYTELPLQEGPYTREVLQSATWHSLPEPFHTRIPTLGGKGGNNREVEDDDKEEDSEDAAADYQQELAMLNQRGSSGLWEQVRLHYPLAAKTSFSSSSDASEKSVPTEEGNRDVSITVLAIETAPFVHTRLVKQWHNAARGLRILLDGQSNNSTVGGLPSFAIAWNPQHMRRSLRLFTQDGLRLLFTKMALTLRGSTEEENAATLFYGVAATAVTDMALQIITLSRQVGAQLRQEDVEVVVELLRASRAAGHLIVNSTSRSKLLLESAVRSRLANHVLTVEKKRNHGSSDENGNEEKEEEEEEEGGTTFYNLPNELRVERALHVRYAPNAWTQQLRVKSSDHAAAVAGAIQHLKTIAPLLQQQQEQQEEGEKEDSSLHNGKKGNIALLPDWVMLGQRAHPDSAFTEYESVLFHTSKLS